MEVHIRLSIYILIHLYYYVWDDEIYRATKKMHCALIAYTSKPKINFLYIYLFFPKKNNPPNEH